MHMIRVKYAETGDINTAVRETIRECINSDVIREYLMDQRGDIMSVLEVNLTIEEREEIRWQDGYEEGCEEATLKIAKKLKASGMDVEAIAENTGLSVEEVEGL